MPQLSSDASVPRGLWLHCYMVEPSEVQHMSQMHYFCLLDERCLCLEPSNSLPLFTELPRRVRFGDWASDKFDSRKLSSPYARRSFGSRQSTPRARKHYQHECKHKAYSLYRDKSFESAR